MTYRTGLSPQIRILPGGDQRLLAEIGVVDPTSLDSYRKAGGYAGLKRAIEKLGPEGTIDEIADRRPARPGWRRLSRPPTSGAPPGPPRATARSWSPT